MYSRAAFNRVNTVIVVEELLAGEGNVMHRAYKCMKRGRYCSMIIPSQVQMIFSSLIRTSYCRFLDTCILILLLVAFAYAGHRCYVTG